MIKTLTCSSDEFAEAPRRCNVCGRPDLKKGRRCSACRVRKCRGAVIDGETCCVPDCGVDHPRALRWHRFTDGTRALFANHHAIAGRNPIAWSDFLVHAIDADLCGWSQSA
jgi:hypothetical protein